MKSRSRTSDWTITSSGGLFIVLEGPEGAGKTTQARLLAEFLRARGVPHVLTREPGGTAVGEQIRRVVLQGGAVPARTEVLLFFAARAAFVDQVVQPALEAGKVVIADRYTLSTLAYQGYGRGLPLEEIQRLNDFASRRVAPDLTLVLNISAAVGEARRQAAGLDADRIEGAGEAFHARVAEAYALLAQGEPDVETIDGSVDPRAVHEEIVRRLAVRFPETFRANPGFSPGSGRSLDRSPGTEAE